QALVVREQLLHVPVVLAEERRRFPPVQFGGGHGESPSISRPCRSCRRPCRPPCRSISRPSPRGLFHRLPGSARCTPRPEPARAFWPDSSMPSFVRPILDGEPERREM